MIDLVKRGIILKSEESDLVEVPDRVILRREAWKHKILYTQGRKLSFCL